MVSFRSMYFNGTLFLNTEWGFPASLVLCWYSWGLPGPLTQRHSHLLSLDGLSTVLTLYSFLSVPLLPALQ